MTGHGCISRPASGRSCLVRRACGLFQRNVLLLLVKLAWLNPMIPLSACPRWGGVVRLLPIMGLLACAAPQAAEVEQREILQVSPLAGFQHHAGAALFALMSVGDRLALRRESDNPFDEKAVRVEWHGTQIGYAPRADNVDLARLMDRGIPVEARILHLQKSHDPWKRVLIEIYLAPKP